MIQKSEAERASRSRGAKSVKRAAVANAEPAARAEPAELTLEALAQRILSREVRPRTADIRRLAEAVLTAQPAQKPKKAKALGDGKDQPRADKKAAKKKKKLAKIPGQKAKK